MESLGLVYSKTGHVHRCAVRVTRTPQAASCCWIATQFSAVDSTCSIGVGSGPHPGIGQPKKRSNSFSAAHVTGCSILHWLEVVFLWGKEGTFCSPWQKQFKDDGCVFGEYPFQVGLQGSHEETTHFHAPLSHIPMLAPKAAGS